MIRSTPGNRPPPMPLPQAELSNNFVTRALEIVYRTPDAPGSAGCRDLQATRLRSPKTVLTGRNRDIDFSKTTQLLKARSAALARSFIVVKKPLL
jgi:hypothetical protein